MIRVRKLGELCFRSVLPVLMTLSGTWFTQFPNPNHYNESSGVQHSAKYPAVGEGMVREQQKCLLAKPMKWPILQLWHEWKRRWNWSCCDTTLPAFSCKSCCSYTYKSLSSIIKFISIRKQRRFVSKQGQPQPYFTQRLGVKPTTRKWSFTEYPQIGCAWLLLQKYINGH